MLPLLGRLSKNSTFHLITKFREKSVLSVIVKHADHTAKQKGSEIHLRTFLQRWLFVCVTECGSAEVMKGRERRGGILLTYLVARSVRFLQPHPPLIVQFDRHAAAAGRVLAGPAEELLEFPPQGGVLLAGLRVAGAALQPLWRAGGEGGGRRGRG